MDANEQKILRALAGMVVQYLEHTDADEFDTMCMSAGERAVEVLAEYGLVMDLDGRNARWTEAGKEFLNSF